MLAMAKPQIHGSKRKAPVSPSSSKNKVKQMSVWDMKRKLAQERLMGLENNKNDEEPVATSKPVVRNPPKVKTKSELNGSVGFSSPMERAEEVRANLSANFPSFMKRMLMSHVTGGFWLGLPRDFCRAHLPGYDETVVLVDENEHEYNTKYLVHKNGLSGGWRGFSIAHNLFEGDVLVFQLIEPCKFKLYIVRARTLTEVDGAMSLLNLDCHAQPINAVKMEDQPDENAQIIKTEGQNCPEPVEAHNHQTNTGLIPIAEPATDQSGDDSDNPSSEIMDGIRFSEDPLIFKDVKSFKDFKIQVDGLIIDSELPIHLRTKYYELCRSQSMFLHDNLIPGLNIKLAAGMISETINIADAIRAADPITGPNHLESWDRTLKAFEDMGMAVGFLRARIDKLLSLSREAWARIESKRSERDKAQGEMRALKVKILGVESLIKKLDNEIDDLEMKNEELGVVFKEIACASW